MSNELLAANLNLAADIARIPELKAKGGSNGWYSGHCPAHDDKSASFRWRDDEQGKIQLKCFAGCDTPSIFRALKNKGIVFPGKETKQSSEWRSAGNDIFYFHEWGEMEKFYIYQDAKGKEIFRCARFYPKNFRQGHYIDGKFKWNVDGVRLELYRLPKLLEAGRKGRTVLFVEGEKDVETAESLGFTATTTPRGADKAFEPQYATALIGCKVVMIADLDKKPNPNSGEFVGEKHGNKVCHNLAKAGISVRMTIGIEGYKDLTDWVNAGGTAERLKQLLSKLEPWQPPETLCSEKSVEGLSWLIDVKPLSRKITPAQPYPIEALPDLLSSAIL